MEIQSLRLINSLGKTNQRKSLKTFAHKNINDAVKHYTDISKIYILKKKNKMLTIK